MALILALIAMLTAIVIALLSYRYTNRLYGMQAQFRELVEANVPQEAARQIVIDSWPVWRFR